MKIFISVCVVLYIGIRMVLVYECPVIICGYDKLNFQHPSVGAGDGSAFGQCFSLSNDYRLTHVFFHLDRVNSPIAGLQ